MKRVLSTALIAAAAMGIGACADSGSGVDAYAVPPGDWHTINRDLAASRYSPLAQIDPTNVGGLTEAWRYELGGSSTAVPIVVDGILYSSSANRVVALDADTGEELWVHEVTPPPSERGSRAPAVSHRGVAYWPGDAEHAPRIVFMSRSRLMALDAATGEPAAGFGTGGAGDVGVPYGGTPTIFRHVAVIGAAVGELPRGAPGNPRAFDVRTGEKLWEFQTVPQPGQPYHETWLDGWEEASGTNMWAFAAPVDTERGIVYVAISSPSPNYYGGERPGANVFGNSIVALDIETGAYLWHFQTVHHDLWDADMPSTGALFDFVTEDGRRVPALAHVGKTSYVYVLDRVTGEPLIEVEERPVPRGDVPGEWYSPTQPFPVRPGPLSRVSFDPDEDLVSAEDTTPEHAAACRVFMERSGGFYNEGPFTPFPYKAPDAPPRSAIQLPGGTGGVNWGGMAFDTTTGVFFVNAQETSLVGWVEDKPPGETYSFEAPESPTPYDRASILGKGPFFTFNAPVGGEFDEEGRPVGPTLPCYKPPWGRLIAVDANAGEILWASVLGTNDLLPEGKQLVGSSGSAGPTVTAGGLVFVGATRDNRFRAFDAASGEELWSAALDANANANPMSYLGRSGRQYVAVVATNTLVAYGLPEAAAADGHDQH